MSFGNKGGGYHRGGPVYRDQVTSPVSTAQLAYLKKQQRIQGGSLAEKLRRCVERCMELDADLPQVRGHQLPVPVVFSNAKAEMREESGM